IPKHDKLLLKKCLQASGFSVHEIDNFQQALAGSPRSTIDRFLELRPEFAPIGKLAIAATISFYDARCRFKRRANTQHLYRRLYEALFPHPKQPNRSIRIITFNYDRSLEKYLAE